MTRETTELLYDGSGVEEPENYIATQRNYNLTHSDGQPYRLTEEVREHVSYMATILRTSKAYPATALFAGCRMGCEVAQFIEHFALTECTGIDIVPEFVNEAAKRVLSAKFEVQDMHTLPYADDAFSVTFSSQALEHCYNVRKAFDELLRVTSNAVYLSLPLESTTKYEGNTSHFAYVMNPMGWLNLFNAYPNWRVTFVHIPEANTVDIYAVNVGSEFDG